MNFYNVHLNNLKVWLFLSQFMADADDTDAWMLDLLRLVSSEDVGHDEASVLSLVRKHKVENMKRIARLI